MAIMRQWIGDRLAQVVLILAAGIMITGVAIGFLAPSLREAPPFVTDDIEKAAEAIAGNPTAWVWANGLILAAAIITALALVGLSAQFQGRSRIWAWTGLVAYAFAAVFMAVDRLITMGVTTWAAPKYPDATVFTVFEAFDRFSGGLGSGFHILGFIALGLFGVAMTQTERARQPGWVFVTAGVLGVVLELAGGAIPAMVFLGTAALGAATWQSVGQEPAERHA